jgi:hypothetical protein
LLWNHENLCAALHDNIHQFLPVPIQS